MKKEYSNGEITIVWEPTKCQHAGICVKTLPEVYKPKEKPWINPEKATSEQLKAQVDMCPSKALTYYKNSTEPVLFDNEEKKQFELRIEGFTPRIEYIKSKNGKIFLTHTEVPAALEGKGIGSKMVSMVLEDIKQKDLILVPLCPFVAGYIKKHPEWRELVLKGINIE